MKKYYALTNELVSTQLKVNKKPKAFRQITRIGICFFLLGTPLSFSFANNNLVNRIEMTNAKQEAIALKGKVVDADDQFGVAGVSVYDQNNKVVGVTNGQGEFSFSVAKGDVLSFSSLGYTIYKQTFDQSNQNLTIQLTSSNIALTEVAVTALGIKREEKSLG